jgi:Cu+-exporting ATPase
MRCGGCAKRIERALANVDGVLGVKADVRMARVEIATKAGVDARALVKPTIDGLGYQVQ